MHERATSPLDSASDRRLGVGTLVDRQKERAADALDEFVVAILDAAHRLEESGQTTLARSALSLARGADRISHYVRERPAAEMLGDARSAARRNPTAFLASAFAAGLLLGRLARSSGPHHLEA
jgi:hypothetical protein